MMDGRSPSVKRAKPVDSSIESETSPSQPAVTVKSCETKVAPKKRKVANIKSASITDYFTSKAVMAENEVNVSGDLEEEEGSGDEQCSNKDIMRVLVNIKHEIKSVNSKLDGVNLIVERLEGEIMDLRIENDKLKEEITKVKLIQENSQEKIKEAHLLASLSHEHADRNEQYARRNNVKIMYVDESESETVEESEKIALKIFRDKLKMNIKPEEIEVAHRVGKKNSGKNRPLLVKFVSRKTKSAVIRNRKLLKGSQPKVVIFEDLTKNVYQLHQHATNHLFTQDAWTSEGKIFVKDANGKVHLIQKIGDLDKLPPPPFCDSQSSTPKHAERQPPPRNRKNRQHSKTLASESMCD